MAQQPFPKVWWLDDTDVFSAKDKLRSLKEGQLAEWDWIRFEEAAYKNAAEACNSLISDIRTCSMFFPGKVIYTYGVPSFQAKFAPNLANIADNVLLIVVARIDKVTTLFKTMQKMAKDTMEARIDERFELSSGNAEKWVTDRAKDVSLRITPIAARYMADLCSYSPNLIRMEMEKMKSLAEASGITEDLIDTICSGTGDADVMKMADAILEGNAEKAHALCQRMMDRGDDPEALCGFLMDWSRRLAIAHSIECNLDYNTKVRAGAIKKLSKDRKEGDPFPEMFKNPDGLNYSCNNLAKYQKPPEWAYDVVRKLGETILMMRSGYGGAGGGRNPNRHPSRIEGLRLEKDAASGDAAYRSFLLHEFIAEVTK